MQNVKLLRRVDSAVELPPGSGEADSRVSFLAHDSDSGHIFAITDSCVVLNVNTLTNEVLFEHPLEQQSQLVAAQYVPDLQSLCLASQEGDIILIEAATHKEESVGTIENGIAAMCWSPDFEIVVFVTRANTLLMMTQDWDPILEQPLIPNNPELFQKTQFDASAPRISWRGDGQFFVVSSAENGVTVFRTYERSGKLHSRSEDVSKSGMQQSNLICWKPSGELIASSARHSGSGKHEIIFFERNGLRHGEFALRDPDAKVLGIQWNGASDLLAVLLELSPSRNAIQIWYTKNYHWYMKQQLEVSQASCMEWDQERVNLLHVGTADGHLSSFEFALTVDISQGNYESNESLVAMIDGSKIGLTPTRRVVPPPPFTSAEVTIAPERVSCLDFALRTCEMAVKHSGAKISVFAPYAPSIQPGKPPVYNIAPKLVASYNLEATVADLRSIQFIEQNHVVGVLSTVDGDELVLLHLSGETAAVAARVRAVKHPLRVLVLVQNKDTGSIFVEFDNGHVSQVMVSADFSSMRLNASAQLPAPCPWLYSAIFSDSHSGAADVLDQDEHIIGLSERSKLYIQRAGAPEMSATVVSQECNSFAVQYGQFLLFTTVSHTLRFMSLHRTVEENMEILATASSKKSATASTSKGGGASSTGGNWNDSIREVEQGAILISVVANLGTRVVLQMPRGNLETIEPRALVVSQVRRSIDALDYKSAFLASRKHRLDLNLLYDHNPTLMMNNLESFVNQVSDIDFLNLFISSLSKEDVTKTIFVDLWRDPKAKEPQDQVIKNKLRSIKLGKPLPASENKVSHICDSLRAVFQRLDASKFLLPILTTYVHRTPAQVEEALKLIQRLRQAEQSQGLSAESSSHTSAEKALKYLIFLVDVNVLYDIALGMYDLDLVLAVAQKSQKDPREYLPFLAALQQQEKFVQRFNIDLHLKRFNKALESISQAEPQEKYFKEKVVALVDERKLYAKAIEIYYNNPNREYLTTLYDLYARELVVLKHYGQAAMCWRATGSASFLPSALEAYKKHGDWRGAISCALDMNLEQSGRAELYQELASQLVMQYKFEDAAAIFDTYLDNFDEALSALVQGNLWEQAVLLCSRRGQQATVQSVIKPAVSEACDSYLRDFAETIVKFTKYHNRLVVVRANKYIQSQQLANAPTEAEIEGSETGSIYSAGSGSGSESESAGDDAASRRSGVSRSRGRGGRGGRGGKRPRNPNSTQPVGKKKVSGRKGSPHEEEYLVTEMQAMLPTSKVQDDIRYLLRQLVIFGMREKALQLQKRFGDWLETATKAVPLLGTLSPKTREEKEMEEQDKKNRDELLDAIIHPIALPMVSATVQVPRTSWDLELLK